MIRDPGPTLFELPPCPDGATFDRAKDGERLDTQHKRVLALMSDGRWRTLADIAEVVPGLTTALSARVRDLRKPKFGGHNVEIERVKGGLNKYRVTVRKDQT